MDNTWKPRGKRMPKELSKTMKDIEESNVQLFQMKEDYSEFKALLKGPDDTPYEGGTFELSIEVPQDYPFKPPLIKFVTNIWHPNISIEGYRGSGIICLEEFKFEWNPARNIS